MGERTAIPWATSTFNPWYGCTEVSPGCDHCYARTLMDERYHKVKWGAGQPRVRTKTWDQPIAWNRKAAASGEPWRVFCASLGDVFDNEVPAAWRADLFDLIDATPALTWLLLTKRIGNVQATRMPANVWLGITVVNQAEANRDIPKLLNVQARVRFLSCEPLLEPIKIPGFDASSSWCPICSAIVKDTIGTPHELSHEGLDLSSDFDPTKHCSDIPAMLNWVIVGGESGAGARAFDLAWAHSLRDQCRYAGTAFFMKQLGAYPVDYTRPSAMTIGDGGSGASVHMTKDRAGADPAEWPEDLRVQEFPA